MRTIFYDTETTGLKPEKDRVIEIAAYDPVTKQSFVKLVNPGFPIPSEVSAIHHITDEMVVGCPSFDQVAKEFVEFCDGDVILIAHNNDTFDKLFLQQEFARNNIEMPSWKFLDSLKWARRYRPDLPRHTLQFLREIYGIAQNNAHRALDDVIILHEVFSKMTDDLSIHKILELLHHPRAINTMPFGKHQGKPLASLPRDYVEWLAGSGALDKPDNLELRSSLVKVGLLKAS